MLRCKSYVILTGVIVLLFSVIIIQSKMSNISNEEASKRLKKYLVENNQWSNEYILETYKTTVKIGDEEIYRFDIRYNDYIEQVGGRLVGSWGISCKGDRIFEYNSANDEWILIK